MVTTGNFMLQHKNVLSLLYFSCDLSFIILTFFSTFYFLLPAFLVATFELMLQPKHKHSISQQFQSIQFQSKQLQLNSSSSCKNFNNFHYASHSKFNHPKQDKNSPKLSIMLYQKEILKIKKRRIYCPFLISYVD